MAKRSTNVTIEVSKNDKPYFFSVPYGVSFAEAYDAALEVLTEIGAMAKEAAELAKPQVEHAPVEPEVVERVDQQ